jgi:hypothetical protein
MQHDIPSTAAASPNRPPRFDGPRPGLWYLDLLFRPTRFFTSWVESPPQIVVAAAAWVMGIALAMDRIDTQMAKADLGGAAPITSLVDGWGVYWGFVLAMGALGGAMHYVWGGWWYRVRLGWAGATAPDKILARRAYTFASLVDSVPFVLVAAWQTIVYADPTAAWNGDDWSFLVVAFVFWACFVRYKAARACFDVGVWRARLWFFILPSAFYALTAAAIVAAFVLGAD